MTAKTAECRWCGLRLQGKPYSMGGNAYHPHSMERAKINHYGGFVCSKTCDRRASLDLEQSMPGHGIGQKKLSCYAEAALERNWA